MKITIVTAVMLTLSVLSLNAEVIVVNQYGGGKSQLLDFSSGKPKTIWDKKKSGRINAFVPLYGPVHAVGSSSLYFMESSVSQAYLYEYDLSAKTTRVLWEATKQDTRQGVFNPWSFADSMAIDQESQIVYWTGRSAGRNGPTTFYGFDINQENAQPFQLQHITIATGRQLGQAVVTGGNLYVSSIREGIWEFPLVKGSGRLLIERDDFEKGNVRGPALNPEQRALYFAVGSGLYVISLINKSEAVKIGSLDFCCSTLHGLALSPSRKQLYITAQNLKGPGRKGSTLYKFDLAAGKVNKQGIPFLRTSSAAKNILSFE